MCGWLYNIQNGWKRFQKIFVIALQMIYRMLMKLDNVLSTFGKNNMSEREKIPGWENGKKTINMMCCVYEKSAISRRFKDAHINILQFKCNCNTKTWMTSEVGLKITETEQNIHCNVQQIWYSIMLKLSFSINFTALWTKISLSALP